MSLIWGRGVLIDELMPQQPKSWLGPFNELTFTPTYLEQSEMLYVNPEVVHNAHSSRSILALGRRKGNCSGKDDCHFSISSINQEVVNDIVSLGSDD